MANVTIFIASKATGSTIAIIGRQPNGGLLPACSPPTSLPAAPVGARGVIVPGNKILVTAAVPGLLIIHGVTYC